MKSFRLIPLAIGLVLGSVQADPIGILNFSFEDPVVTLGPPAVFNTAVTDWQDIGAAGDNGVFRGNGDFGQLAAPTDGVQIAFMNDRETNALVQTLGTNYGAGLDYTLKVDVASRNAPIDVPDGATLVLFTGNITTVAELTATNIVATFFVNSVSGLTTDVFNTFTLTATAAQIAAVSGVGQPIGIAIVGGIIGGTVTNRTQNYDLDNVRLDSSVATQSFAVKIFQSGGALDFEWNSILGKQYDLLSSTDLATSPSTWQPYNDGVTTHENIAAAGATTTLTGVLKGGPIRFFVVREEIP